MKKRLTLKNETHGTSVVVVGLHVRNYAEGAAAWRISYATGRRIAPLLCAEGCCQNYGIRARNTRCVEYPAALEIELPCK